MATKANDPCRDKSRDDEPIFTLCARDLSADRYVEGWAQEHSNRLGQYHPKIVEARAVAEAMRRWANRNMPD